MECGRAPLRQWRCLQMSSLVALARFPPMKYSWAPLLKFSQLRTILNMVCTKGLSQLKGVLVNGLGSNPKIKFWHILFNNESIKLYLSNTFHSVLLLAHIWRQQSRQLFVQHTLWLRIREWISPHHNFSPPLIYHLQMSCLSIPLLAGMCCQTKCVKLSQRCNTLIMSMILKHTLCMESFSDCATITSICKKCSSKSISPWNIGLSMGDEDTLWYLHCWHLLDVHTHTSPNFGPCDTRETQVFLRRPSHAQYQPKEIQGFCYFNLSRHTPISVC